MRVRGMGGETIKMERRGDSKMGEKTERRGDEKRYKETGILKLLIRDRNIEIVDKRQEY